MTINEDSDLAEVGAEAPLTVPPLTVPASVDSPRPPVKLTFIVIGEEVHLQAPATQTLDSLVQEVLAKSMNTGRLNAWELRYEAGQRIYDQSKMVGDYGFAPGSRLYLTVEIGVGANSPRPPRATVRIPRESVQEIADEYFRGRE